ncbi:hypothetical protein VP1G_11262 [Cytospora mali]|uniref:Uncharacterized protein n=1 Tax=Cytospora mali TaxID=578113 RepID=A0A194V9Z5_CYTMA|nr:hypothetical protein VP1G_11262 [Valsa mali var. pyri (nom. inval.)]
MIGLEASAVLGTVIPYSIDANRLLRSKVGNTRVVADAGAGLQMQTQTQRDGVKLEVGGSRVGIKV